MKLNSGIVTVQSLIRLLNGDSLTLGACARGTVVVRSVNLCAAEEMATGGYSDNNSDGSCSEASIYTSYCSSEEECMEEGGDAGASAGSKTFGLVKHGHHKEVDCTRFNIQNQNLNVVYIYAVHRPTNLQ